MTQIPTAHSADPADRVKLACVQWTHTHLRVCPKCMQPALVGFLDGAPVAYSCHKCGPLEAPVQG